MQDNFPLSITQSPSNMSPHGRKIKWYSKYVFLVGAILSFADPITDILTLVEFYLADHKTWFVVALGFVVLPWLPFGIYYVTLKKPLLHSVHRLKRLPTCSWFRSFLIGFNPFSAGVARLRMFIFCVKNGDDTPVSMQIQKGELIYSQTAAFFEAVLESAPQFVIQLYVISVQDDQVSIIQMISLPVSFLSLVWTFTSTEELFNSKEITDDIHVKHKVLLFVTYVFLLSSRLFAVVYFTVSYKWWIICFLMLHNMIVATFGYITMIACPLFTFIYAVELFGKFCVQWIKDDFPVFPLTPKNTIRWLSNALFVVENLVMILLLYFSRHSNTWYALPVVVCVCSFTVLGTIMRITHFYFLQKEEQVTRNVPVIPQLEKNVMPLTNFENLYYCYETAV